VQKHAPPRSGANNTYRRTLCTSVKRQSDNEKFAVKKQKRKNIKWTAHAQNNTFASSDTQADASACKRVVFLPTHRTIHGKMNYIVNYLIMKFDLC
jgi:hypothetical protein